MNIHIISLYLPDLLKNYFKIFLFFKGAQEAARCIMDKSAQEIRDMLGLPDVRNFCILFNFE